ncbi:TPA: PhoD-like phosphatase N-terminal domain-containing protein, partial [Salmonella enterica subsp. enterica serovar Typhi]|nr:PhoD-like phosphatase N-terminal domain-containing protein [Salmonella enterica subsp. enterica serovar Typhi]
MTHEGPLEEWMKKLSEESLKDNTFDRRRFIQGAGKIAGLSLGLAIAQSMGAMEVNAAPRFSEYPFTLGVASGDPLSDSVVLWTRLAPDPLNGGGMPNEAVSVKWELAEDERFRRVVKRGTEKATPHLAHSVH